MWKRLIGILVVLVMALSLPMVALADNGGDNDDDEYECICGEECSLQSPVEMPPDTELLDPAEDVKLSNTEGGDPLPDGGDDPGINDIPSLCSILNGDAAGELLDNDSPGLLEFLDEENISFDAIMPIGDLDNVENRNTPLWISFSSSSLDGELDTVSIVRYRVGNGWEVITTARFIDGEWWFQIGADQFTGTTRMFLFALIEFGVPRPDAVEIVRQVRQVWDWETFVLGEVSPDTGDSNIGMFGMIAIILSALGISGFAITRAKKEMSK